MPANLPPQYNKAEDEYRHASTPAERLEKLREMFRLLPKHKGTEKLQSDLKQKISRCRDEIDHAKPGAKKAGLSYRVPHEGAGQVVLVGTANVGKSALLAALTKAHPEVAPYPFTTRVPQPGMMAWEDVAVQLVDLPPITPDFFEPWVTGIIRSADAAALVVDLSDDDLIETADVVLKRLEAQHTELLSTLPFDVEDEAIRHIRTLVLANKSDAPGGQDRLSLFREYLGDRFPIASASAVTGEGLTAVRASLYNLLGVIRIYTKAPGKPAERTHPYTLPHGSNVLDLARAIHRDLEHTLKSARVWGTGVFEGQTVKRDHELHDGDLVEIHG
jgi:ribosome-interacting GTPase 1